MFPLLGSLITGGAGLLGSLMSSSSNAANIAMQQQTNQMNIAENQKNRDFQEQMSNTAYQRASQDMQKAGLNPAAMFGGGSAASTPGGGVPNIQAPRGDPHSGMANLGRVAESAVSSAVNVKTMEKMTDEISNLQTQRKYISALEAATKTDTERKQYEMPESQLRGEEAGGKLGVWRSVRDRLNQIEYLLTKGGNSVSALGDAIGTFAGGAKTLKHLYSGSMFGRDKTGLSPSETRDLYNRFKAMDKE